MKIEIINSISEFLNVIHRNEYFDNNWYRGHTEASFRLEPTLYRCKKKILTGKEPIQLQHFEVKNENLMIKEFKKLHRKKNMDFNLSDIECLYIMQHNGNESRLLDFSSNPLIALFFSVIDKKKIDLKNETFVRENELHEQCSSVFCIDPILVNKFSFGLEKIIDLTNTNFNNIKNLQTPICIEPKNIKIDSRLERQKGKFLLFGREIHPLDWYEISRKFILKILIPNSKRSKIRNELNKKFGINYSYLYPDNEGIKLQIQKLVEDKHVKL